MVDLITDDMLDTIARAIWDSRFPGDEPRTSWDAAKMKLRYSHAAVLREARIALETGLPMIAERLQDVEGGASQVLDDLVSRARSSATPDSAATRSKATS